MERSTPLVPRWLLEVPPVLGLPTLEPPLLRAPPLDAPPLVVLLGAPAVVALPAAPTAPLELSLSRLS